MFNGFGFGGMGGMGGMGGGAPRRPAADTTKLYTLLDVPKDASEADIKKAYRRQAMTHHPDKGGDEQKFTEIQTAYEILSNPDKRRLYDEGGLEAVESGGAGGGGDMSDIFEMFGGGGGRRRQQRRRGEDVLFPLPVTLEELYTGAVKKLRLTRNVICKPCNGKGGSGVTECNGCNGRGVKVVVRQVGPGMISQSQVTCPTCKGQGKVIPPGNKCKSCNGECTVKEKQQIDVTIPRGSFDGTDLVFKGMADEAPDADTGDVVVRLETKPHDVFKRESYHLIRNVDISLYEALTGFTLKLKTLDGRVLVYNHKETVVPGTYIKIEDEGLPKPKNGGIQSGDLYLKINIVFPTEVVSDENKKQMLAGIIGKTVKRVDAADGKEEVSTGYAVDFAKEQEKFKREDAARQREENNSRRRQQADDDDDGGHAGGPACQQV